MLVYLVSTHVYGIHRRLVNNREEGTASGCDGCVRRRSREELFASPLLPVRRRWGRRSRNKTRERREAGDHTS